MTSGGARGRFTRCFRAVGAGFTPRRARSARPDAIREHAMPYANTRDLPDPVRNALPAHAQDIYKEAFNHAWDEYKDPDERRSDESQEEVAHKVAWSAVKTKYEKGDDGHWHARHH
jgi:cation transport regulator